MPPAPAAPHTSPFDIKSAQWPLVAMVLRSADILVLQQEWAQKFGDQPDFFDHDPLVIDFTALPPASSLDALALVDWLRSRRLRPLAFKGGDAAQRDAAVAAGLACADDAMALDRRSDAAVPEPPMPAPSPEAAPAPSRTALVVDRPLRSGQQVYARGRDLIVTAMVNPGAEVVADGHIHVYAPLRGKAIAGARGDTTARIFARAMEAELVSIAGVYRTSEIPLPDGLRGKPAQIRLDSSEQGDRLLIEPLA